MQLSDLKSHPVIKWMAYFGFGLIIISFVFFYGWNKSSRQHMEEAASFGRIESDDPLGFLPWRKWENIPAGEVRSARFQVVNRKLGTLDPTMQMILMQEGQRMGLRLEQVLSTDPEALQQAVDLRLLGREAEEIGLRVSREEIMTQIRNEPGMTAELWQQILAAEGITEREYIERLQKNQTAALVQELRGDEARLTLPELWREYQFENEKLRLEVLNFPAGRYTGEVTVTEADLQAWLDGHQEDYRVPTRRKYGYVVVDRPSIAAAVQVTEADARKYYDEHPDEFRVAEAALIEDFFAPVSDDQSTTVAESLIGEARTSALAQPGADWEGIRNALREQHPEQRFYFREVGPVEAGADAEAVHGADYVKAALALAEGAQSEPVTSPLGVHLLRRTGTRAAELPAFEEVRARVEERAREAEIERRYAERQDIVKKEVGNFATLEDFARERGFDYGTTGMIDAAESVLPDVADLTPHRSYFRGLKPGQISEMIPLGDRVMAIQVLEEQATYIPALDEVRDSVRRTVESEKAVEHAREKAEAARAAAAAGKALIALARDENSTTTLTPAMTRRELARSAPDSGLEAPLLDFLKQTSRAKPGSIGVSAYGVPGGETEGFALWQVLDLEAPVREDFMASRHRFAAGRLPGAQSVLVEEWEGDLRRSVDYEIRGAGAI